MSIINCIFIVIQVMQMQMQLCETDGPMIHLNGPLDNDFHLSKNIGMVVDVV